MTRMNELNAARLRDATRTAQIPLAQNPLAQIPLIDARSTILEPRRTQGDTLVAAIATAVVWPIARALHRRRTIAELSRLDSSALEDIGLPRAEIRAVATTLADRRNPGKPVRVGLFGAIRNARARRVAIRELQRLSDRMLADIGLQRGQIAATVDHLLAESNGKPARAAAAPSPVHDLLRRVDPEVVTTGRLGATANHNTRYAGAA